MGRGRLEADVCSGLRHAARLGQTCSGHHTCHCHEILETGYDRQIL